METSVLIQVPYELESAYSPLEERTDIDYTVMSVDNFNVGDFLIGLYITISSNSIITGVVSGMIWDVIKIVSHDVLDKLRQSSKEKTSEKISEQPNKEDGEQPGGFDNQCDRTASESRAFSAEIKCLLQNKISKPECTDVVNARMINRKEEIKKYAEDGRPLEVVIILGDNNEEVPETPQMPPLI